MQPAIKIENLSKRYQIGKRLNGNQSFQEQLKDLVVGPFQRLGRALKGEHLVRTEDFWALKDVSFEVQPGEVVGIIGRNGAGKSTLLKILSRITEPTTGQITINGRVASLLEVGTGFHPELTGRENVYLNGSILGMKKSEIDAKFDEIVEFSGIEKFLDTPVKRYSSGMYVRLAFSVSAHLDPDVLIVDEVLAVGDAEFQKRCLRKMRSVSGSGKTVLFVSHNMAAISALCQSAIWLKNGSLAMEKSNHELVIDKYMSSGASSAGFVDLTDWREDRRGNGPMQVRSIRLLDAKGATRASFQHGEEIEFRVMVWSDIPRRFHIGLSIRNQMGHLLIHSTNYDDPGAPTRVPEGESFVSCRIPNIVLNSGSYYTTVWLGENQFLHDRVGDCLKFDIDASRTGNTRCAAPFLVKSNWDANTT